MPVLLRLFFTGFLASGLVLSGFPDTLLGPLGQGAVAWADDDDDGDDDDDDDDDRGSRSGRGGGGNAQRGGGGVNPLQWLFGRPTPQRPRAAAQPRPLPQFAPELVVNELSSDDLQVLLTEGFSLIETTALPGLSVTLRRLSAPDGQTLPQARERIRQLPTGLDADFNHYYRASQASAVPASALACGHANCAAHDLISWPDYEQRQSACRVSQPVGIIDTGVNADHDLLRDAQIEVISIGAGDSGTASQKIHGTAVVSALAGTSENRVQGLLPEAPLVVADVFSRNGKDERADVVSLLRGLDEMQRRGVRLVNLSLSGPDNEVLRKMVGQMVGIHQMVLIAAAGNAGPKAPVAYPAGYEGVIAVTAVDRRGRVYSQAQRGTHLDLSAPGVGLVLATSISGAREKTGTSFAAPFVTSAAALVLAREPGLTPAEVAGRLQEATRDLGAEGPDEIFGHGLLQAGPLCPPLPATVAP